MPRNLKGELIVAVGALIVLIGAVGIAALLSQAATEPIAAVTAAADITFLPQAEATATATPAPTLTPTLVILQLPALTPVPPTSTATLTPTATTTPVPPSPTPTLGITPLPIVLVTPITPPTSTFTVTPTATLTATSSPTLTPLPTETPTLTPLPTETPTVTPTPTETPTVTPLPTLESDILLPLATVLPTLTPAPCTLPEGWSSYVLSEGETLLEVAISAQTTLDDLRNANCLAVEAVLSAGQALFVPMPIGSAALLQPAEDVSEVPVIGCTNPQVLLSLPDGNARSGIFELRGSAASEPFWYYVVEVRPNGSSIYTRYADGFTPVVDGVLAEVNTTWFGAGLFWVRVSVVRPDGTTALDATCEVLFRFE